MSIEIRNLQHPDESGQAFKVFLRAMVGLPPAAARLDPAVALEPGRYLGAFDGDALVGGTDSYTGWLVVPGGQRVPHAAVTHIGVLPTHTRRGIVTRLVERQLADIAAAGAPLASLRASEAVIYERFGYGVASNSAAIRLARRRAQLRPGVPLGGPIRLVEEAEAAKLLPEVYRAAGWTGAIRRPPQWWATHPATGYVAVHGPAGQEDGFVRYHPIGTSTWFTSAERTVVVDDFVAHTADAYAGLLRHLLGIDLVDTIVFEQRSLDDPLPTLLFDQRAVSVDAVRDETWLRLTDVGAALAAREYVGTERLVLAVSDPILPANSGSYVVGAGEVGRTDEPAEVGVDIAGLAAVYLGGTRWWQLARSGRATEHVPGALARADRLFAVTALPFAGTIF